MGNCYSIDHTAEDYIHTDITCNRDEPHYQYRLSNIYFTLFLFQITKQNKTGSIVGNCYSNDHIAEDHIHTYITCNREEPLQKYRLGTVSNRLEGLKLVLLDPNPRP